MLNVVDDYYLERFKHSEEGMEQYQAQLEEPTPLQKAPYARHLVAKSTSTSNGFMEMMNHSSK